LSHDMNQDEHELTKSEEWFRDRLNDFLGYGVAAFTVIIGWLLSSDSLISLSREAGTDKREAALALAILMPVIWILWYAIVLRLHSKCPSHPTVISRRYLHLYAVGVAIALFAIWCLVADVV
jgi:RsiW-degrading membrane proteinase PrsW (M82 family)